jgi:hypothetical protein
MDLVTDVSEAQRADAWNPLPRPFSWTGYAVFALWTIGQPVLDEALLREPPVVGVTQWVLGSAIIFGAVLFRRYRDAAPYRAVVSVLRSENPDSLVFGIRLDPLTTPVGEEWGDSRKIRWGVIIGSSNGVRLVRSDGVVMFDRPWSEFEFSIRGIDVTAGDEVEEWWFQLLSESGVWPRPVFGRRGRSRFLLLQALRPIVPAGNWLRPNAR